jgi:hypothetical protein
VEDDTRVWWPWFDSLIVNVKGGNFMIAVRFMCVMLSGYFPCEVTIDSNLRDTLGYG